MEIGKPQHVHIIEPLELPEPLRQTPEIVPEPARQPEEEPVKHGV